MKETVYLIAAICIGILFFFICDSKSAAMVGMLVSLFGLYILDALDQIMKELKKPKDPS